MVREEGVERLVGSGALEAMVLRGGEVVPRAGLFVAPPQELRSDLHARLGCALTAAGRIQADARGRSSVARVFVAGDAAPGMQSVASAAASGTVAGAGLNLELLEEDF